MTLYLNYSGWVLFHKGQQVLKRSFRTRQKFGFIPFKIDLVQGDLFTHLYLMQFYFQGIFSIHFVYKRSGTEHIPVSIAVDLITAQVIGLKRVGSSICLYHFVW